MPRVDEPPVALSAAALTADAPLRRALEGGARPPEGDAFDALTMLHDVFRSADGAEIVLVGPPPIKLESWLLETVRRAFPAGTAIRLSADDRHCLIRVRSAAGAVQLDEPLLGAPRLEVQPSLCARFAGRRVLFTLSKDNPLRWIADWAAYHAAAHGCDAVLFYDNGSTLYGSDARQALHDTLAAVPGIREVSVVGWPYSYGVEGASNYCQFCMLEHARRRFLAGARSVVNADIDELPLTRDGRSIFEVVEQSATGYLQAKVRFIGNATGAAPEARRHRDFVHRGRKDEFSLPKWAVVPARCPDEAVWRVHRVEGMTSDAAAAANVEFRHFTAINTNWLRPRWQPGVLVGADAVRDEELVAWMARAGWSTA